MPNRVVRDRQGQQLAYVYFEDEPGRRAAAKLLTEDEARRIAVNIAKVPELLVKPYLCWRSIAPLPSVRMWSGWWHVLRIRLAQAAEPACGVHALLKCYEATVCTAASSDVNRAPRIVLGFGWSGEHSCPSNNAERKQNQSHLRLTSRVADGLNTKISASRNLDLSQKLFGRSPLSAAVVCRSNTKLFRRPRCQRSGVDLRLL
jgi:hypothetical protein